MCGPNGLLRVIRAAIAFSILTAASAAGQDTRRADPLRQYVQSCERFGFSGSVLVAKGGKILLADGFGLADREKKVRNSKDTLFEIASATKPFTAVAIFELERDGKLELEDPIGKHLPGVPAGFENVTVRHLLTHTSGMPRSAGSGRGEDLGVAVKAYLSVKPVRKPGAGYEYWNGGYALLAGIVEHVSGGSYMDFCRRRIFEPAGMKSSGFTGDSIDVAKVAIGYEGRGEAPRRADEHPYYGSYGWQYRGMGGLVTNVEDLYRFDRALRDDTLLAAAARTRLFAPCLDGYACGFQVLDKPRKKIGHGGSVRGFHCQFSRYPDDDACIVVLCNGVVLPPFIVEESLAAIAFATPPRYPAPPRTADWAQPKLEELGGSYEASNGERIVVRPLDGNVLLGAEGPGITRELASSGIGSVPLPADPALVEAARTIVQKLSEGDIGPLKERMAPGIPPQWADRMKSQSWPERAAGLGKLKAVRFAGGVRTDSSNTILLACDFEKGAIRVKLVFPSDRFQIFDLNGPEFLVETYAAPSPTGQLVRFNWQGPPAPPITIVRDSSGRPSALRFESPGTGGTYKRLAAK
jgi:CubicO group peptidase (beta-lactamase class C family)